MAVYKIDGFGTRNQTDGSGFDANKERRQRFVQMYASHGISKGDLVALDASGTEPTNGYGNHVRKALATDAVRKIGIGVAAEDIASGDLGNIQVAGYCDFAKSDVSATVNGDFLTVSGDEEGLLDIYDTSETPGANGGDQIPIAISLTEAVGDTAASVVYLLNPLNL